MEVKTICKGCGAQLHYEKTEYGKKAICKYCRQEYQVFDIKLCGKEANGRIYIEMDGQIKEFYIGEMELHPIMFDNYIGLDGQIQRIKPIYKTKLNLIEI